MANGFKSTRKMMPMMFTRMPQVMPQNATVATAVDSSSNSDASIEISATLRSIEKTFIKFVLPVLIQCFVGGIWQLCSKIPLENFSKKLELKVPTPGFQPRSRKRLRNYQKVHKSDLK